MTNTLWATAVLALLIAVGGYHVQLSNEREAHAKTREARERDGRLAADAALLARATAFKREQALTDKLQEYAREVEAQNAVIGDLRAAADAAAVRVRNAQRAADAACRGCSGAANPPAAGPGGSTGAADDLSADVSARLDRAADEIAEFADRLSSAHTACRASYNAVSVDSQTNADLQSPERKELP